MGILSRFAKRHFKKWGGILTFYTVYNPNVRDKNVITHMIHPDIAQDEELNDLMKQVADKVREFYEDSPKLLEEIGHKVEGGK